MAVEVSRIEPGGRITLDLLVVARIAVGGVFEGKVEASSIFEACCA
jgi:hypothetical protein